MIIATVVALVLFIMFFARGKAGYTPLQKSYSHVMGVDTNPARRVSSYFDQCSPEEFGSCPKPQSDPQFVGYPLP